MLGTAAPPLAGVEIDWGRVRQQQYAAAAFVLLLLAPLSLLTSLARHGLPQYWSLMVVSWAVLILGITLPFACMRLLKSDKAGALWLGPLTVLSLLIALVPTYFASFAMPVLALSVSAASIGFTRWGLRVKPWWWLLIGATIYLAFEIGGTKYGSFFADRLALFGRTDGDIFSLGAIVGSIHSYGWPSYAIDGLEPLKYHVGALWLAERLNVVGGGDYISSVVATKIFVLVPLLVYAALHAAILFHAILRPGRAISAATLTGALGIVIFVLRYADIGLATFASETMSLGAALALLVFPSLYLLGSDRDMPRIMRHLAWALAGLALFVIGGSKISMAFVLAFIFGWWLLRTEGLKSLATWLCGGIGFIAFLAAFRMFNDNSSMGAQFFGKPYYVEYGFERGHWLLPITLQFETLAALGLLIFATQRSAGRRLTIETLIVAAIAGNLPGLLMYIQSGNAAYFLVSQAWIAIPILAALLPGAWERLAAQLRTLHRLAPTAAVIVAILAAGYASYGEFRTRASLFLAANAMLRSGDLSYFAEDKRKAWRDDAKRAVKEFGLAYLLTAPAATPPGEALALGLRDLRRTAGDKTALYVPASNTEFWDLVVDCNGKSVFPIAEAGLAMIQGYVPKQSDCPQEFALRGFGRPPDVRPEETPQSICERARRKGFDTVAWLDTLSVKDAKLLNCATE